MYQYYMQIVILHFGTKIMMENIVSVRITILAGLKKVVFGMLQPRHQIAHLESGVFHGLKDQKVGPTHTLFLHSQIPILQCINAL